MLTLTQYLMGREKLYPEEYTLDVRSNAENLLKRVNNLLEALKFGRVEITSGWRPLAINRKVGGAKRSLHSTGRAVDIADTTGILKCAILCHFKLLLEYGLWMEDFDATPGWCHLDTGIRLDRSIRVFKP